jgi:hypothetical protein
MAHGTHGSCSGLHACSVSSAVSDLSGDVFIDDGSIIGHYRRHWRNVKDILIHARTDSIQSSAAIAAWTACAFANAGA